MKAWLLQTGEPVPGVARIRPVRTALLAGAMADAGHEVEWWHNTFHHHSKEFIARPFERRALRDGVTLRFLPGLGYRSNASPRRYLGNLQVARAFRAEARRAAPPDVIVASMPDQHLAWEAVRYAREQGVPVVLDIRDQWPDIFERVFPRPLRPLAHAALARDRARLREAVQGATAVTSMMEELLAWGLAAGDRSRGPLDRVFHLGGPPLAPPQGPPSAPIAGAIAACEGRTVVTYVGTFGQLADPSVIVEAARLLERGPEAGRFGFLLAGDGPNLADVRARSSGLGHVHLTGRILGDDLAAVLQAAHVAIVPTPPGHPSFQNKVFTYLAAGLPILTSASGGVADAAEQWGFGARYRAEDPADLARHIRALGDDEVLRAGMAAAARRAFDEAYDAERIYRDFTRYLEALADAGAPGRPAQPKEKVPWPA